MTTKDHRGPTQAELQILQILWKNYPSTVKYVHKELNKTKNVGYTTALKLMQIMTEKKLLIRHGEGRKHTYEPAQKKEPMQQKLLDRFLNLTFGGSASHLVLQALGQYKPSRAELAEIKELIKSIEEEKL